MSSNTFQQGVLPRNVTLLLVLILLCPSLSGCLGADSKNDNSEDLIHWLPAVEDRSEMIYINDDVFSRVSKNGSHLVGEVQSIFVPVPSISASDGGAGLTGGAEVHLGAARVGRCVRRRGGSGLRKRDEAKKPARGGHHGVQHETSRHAEPLPALRSVNVVVL